MFIEIEIAGRGVALRWVAADAVARRIAAAQAVGVGARHGAEADAQGQGIAAAGVQLQRVQRQIHIGGDAGQPAHQQHADAGGVGGIGVAVEEGGDGG